jgi:WD40 repeat protein
MSVATVPVSSPYKGLAAFDDTDLDALLFFGRARETEVVAANVLASRLTVLYGPSGVGKSSLLRAGVVRAIRAQGSSPVPAVVAYGSWGGDPLAGLEEAARTAVGEALGREPADAPGSLTDRLAAWSAELGAEICLLLDQLEELFLYHAASAGAGGFVDLLPELVNRPGLHINVLLGLRDDALAQLDVFKGRIPGLFANSLRLDNLDRHAGREAILGPLGRYAELDGVRVEIEEGLVDAVLDEVAAGRIDRGLSARGAAALSEDHGDRIETPYLQLVLQRVWEVEHERGSSVLRLATFRDLGGAQRIVEDHLERALRALTPAQQDAAASVFGHLVTPSGMKVAHGVTDLATYAAVGEVELEPILRSLASQRILRPLGENGHAVGGRYEIFHDVLGDAVLAWRTGHQSARALELERDRARRRHRRALFVAAFALVALAAMTALAIYALAQRGEAEEQAEFAQRQKLTAQREATKARARALDATATAMLDTDPEKSLRMAARAAALSATPQAEMVLREALRAARLLAIFPARRAITKAMLSGDGTQVFTASLDGNGRVFDVASHRLVSLFAHGAPVLSGGFDREGRIAATGGEDGRVLIWTPGRPRPLYVLRHGAKVRDVAVSPDGSYVVSAGGRAAKVWRVDDGSLLARLPHETPVTRVVFAPDGRSFVTVSRDSLARLFDTQSGTLLVTFNQGGRVTSAWFPTYYGTLVTAGANKTARVWSLSTGFRLGEVEGHVGPVTKAVLSPRGNFLGTVSTDGSGRIWDARTATVQSLLIGHTNPLQDIAFGPTGFTVVTASRDGTARVWKSDNGDQIGLLAGHRGPVTTAAFSPSGKEVLTASDDGTARLWNAVAQPRLQPIRDMGEPLAEARYVGDGSRILATARTSASFIRAADGKILRSFRVGTPVTEAAASPDGGAVALISASRVIFFDAVTGRPQRSLAHPSTITAFAYASDGQTFATGDTDGAVRVWSRQGALVREFNGHRSAITDLAFDPRGGRVASASRDTTVRLWTVRTPAAGRVLTGHQDDVESVAFSPNGVRLVTASRDHSVIVWRARTGAIEKTLNWHFGAVLDAQFSPDGRWIVTAGPKTAQLWQPGSREPLFRYGLAGHEAPLTSVTFDPSSRLVLTAGLDGTVRRYSCALCGGLRELRVLARDHLADAGRGLTARQRRAYLG